MGSWRRRFEARLRPAVLFTVAAVTVLVVPGLFYPTRPASPSAPSPAGAVDRPIGVPHGLIDLMLPPAIGELPATEAAAAVAADPGLSVAAVRRDPAGTPDPFAAALAGLAGADPGAVRGFFDEVSAEIAEWAAVLFPDSVGNLAGAPYPARIAANRIRLVAETASGTEIPAPVWTPPWTLEASLPFRDTLPAATAHRLVYFDPRANDGQGSWAEVIGDLDTAEHVGILVPGGSASVLSDNFARYALRARSFVDAPEAGGRLAVIVWAGAEFPSGWMQEGLAVYAQRAAPRLAAFSRDLRARLAPQTRVVAVGHSYGGPIVGLAEQYGLDVDVVLHLASAGAGHGVSDVRQLDHPCRTRYSMTAPADLIGYVQGIGDGPGVGHGLDPDEMDGVILLDTGFHVDDPAAVDDIGRPLGDLAGTEISGIHAHSEVFNPGSGAWRNILGVLVDGPLVLEPGPQPPAPAAC